MKPNINDPDSPAAMCLRFAVLHIGHWRKASGPKARQFARRQALSWLAAAKGRAA